MSKQLFDAEDRAIVRRHTLRNLHNPACIRPDGMIQMSRDSAETLDEIDLLIRMQWSLIEDGPSPVIDRHSVWQEIDRLLEKRLAIAGH